jgi:ABC-2 type transport system permease protein
MSLSRTNAIARNTVRLVIHDPGAAIAMTLIPLVFIAFLQPAFGAQFEAPGVDNASSAGIPGMAALFAVMSLQIIVMIYYREHAWGTWSRLRASGATAIEIVVGKSGPLVAVVAFQTVLVFAVSAMVFGFRVTGSLWALGTLILAQSVTVVAFATASVGLFKSLDVAMIAGNAVGMTMAGIGGALAPTETLPDWAQAAAPFTPTYWTIDAMRAVTIDSAGVSDVVTALGVAGVFVAVCLAITVASFRPTDSKVGTT